MFFFPSLSCLCFFIFFFTPTTPTPQKKKKKKKKGGREALSRPGEDDGNGSDGDEEE